MTRCSCGMTRLIPWSGSIDLKATPHRMEESNARNEASNANLKVWIVTMALSTALAIVGATLATARFLLVGG